ncbi:MAG: PGPGW domain-containing protein [Planctomycetota bacterium]
MAQFTWKYVRRITILIVGTAVLLIGIALIVLPGPAIIVIPAGLAILGTEFVWAKWFLNRIKKRAIALRNAITGSKTEGVPPPTFNLSVERPEPKQTTTAQ